MVVCHSGTRDISCLARILYHQSDSQLVASMEQEGVCLTRDLTDSVCVIWCVTYVFRSFPELSSYFQISAEDVRESCPPALARMFTVCSAYEIHRAKFPSRLKDKAVAPGCLCRYVCVHYSECIRKYYERGREGGLGK